MSAGVGEAADADVKRLKRKKEHGIKHYSKHTPRPYLNAGSFDLRVKLWGGGGLQMQECSNKLCRFQNGSAESPPQAQSYGRGD